MWYDLAIAILLLLFGVLLVVGAERLKIKIGEASRITLILAPFIVYMIAAGKIPEFEAAGWKVKLNTIAQTQVNAAASAASLLMADAAGDKADFATDRIFRPCPTYYVIDPDKLAELQAGPPPVATTGEPVDPIRPFAASVLDALLCGDLIAVVFVDRDGRPLGAIPASYFLELASLPLYSHGGTTPSASVMTKMIRTSRLGSVVDSPEVALRQTAANHLVVSDRLQIGEVFKLLLDAKRDFAAVVDDKGSFRGLIDRDAILACLASQLLAPSDDHAARTCAAPANPT